MKKRICYILKKFCDPSNHGGESPMHSSTIKYLAQKGFLVDVYCELSTAKCDYKKQGINTLVTNFSRDIDKYINKINKQNYDLIIGDYATMKKGLFYLDIVSFHSRSDKKSIEGKYGKLIFDLFKPRKNLLKKTEDAINSIKNTHYIFCSNLAKNDFIEEGIDKTKTNVIYPFSHYNPVIKPISHGEFTFGISALGFINKGGYRILLSASLLKLRGMKFKLKIIYKKKPSFIQKLTVRLLNLQKETEFILPLDDMHDFYNSVDCIIMPSKTESFGLVAFEAMGFRLPVIVSSSCGVSELINDGINGFVFEFNENRIINLYKKMLFVLKNKENLDKIKDAALATAQTITKEKYFNAFEKILKKKLFE